jgi:hypothetical protein
MRTSLEIYDDGPLEISDDGPKDEDCEGAIQDSSNYNHVANGRLCTRRIDNGSCSDSRNQQRSEQLPSQPNETRINNAVKKRRVDGSTKCLLGRLPEDILHDILSRLSISDLLRARRTCVAWHRIVSSCNIFQRLYDERSEESWIALTGHPRNPDDFCIFNNNSNKWHFCRARYQADPTKSWLLQGAAEGLMLFVSREGKLGVVNAITRLFRPLPDTKVTPCLRLESCLKKKLLQTKSISINIVVNSAGKTFKVIVWGELRSNQVHALVYSSATDKWTVRLCSDIDCRIFRRPFHSTVDGNTIYIASRYRSVLASYNTETGLFVVQGIIWRLRPLSLGMLVARVRTIGVVVYRNRILLIGVLVGREINGGRPSALVGLWQANPSGGEWELLTTHGLQLPSFEGAAAYDGKHSIIVFPRTPGSNMIFLNLDTKEWRISDGYCRAWRLFHGNARPQRMKCDRQVFRAFHLKINFCTAG